MLSQLQIRIVTAWFLILEIPMPRLADGKLTTTPENREVMVGQSVYFNCSTNESNIHWDFYAVGATGLSGKTVYANGRLLNGYGEKARIDQRSTGAYNLVILSANLGDAGTYVCKDMGIGEKMTAELVVLATAPACSSNINTDQVIGPNPCSLQQDHLILSCKVSYRGNHDPSMKWISSPNREDLEQYVSHTKENGSTINYKLTMTTDRNMAGSSFYCETTKVMSSQYRCTAVHIKDVMYIFDNKQREDPRLGEELKCSYEKSSRLNCSYEWKQFVKKNLEKRSDKENFTPMESGRYECNATCNFKNHDCRLPSKSVYVSNSNKNESSILQCIIVVMLTALLIMIAP